MRVYRKSAIAYSMARSLRETPRSYSTRFGWKRFLALSSRRIQFSRRLAVMHMKDRSQNSANLILLGLILLVTKLRLLIFETSLTYLQRPEAWASYNEKCKRSGVTCRSGN